eukprot:TRINITY_DN8346_c0_g1_i1.p1 TRINITY_DN8346_c0_g1~~TRINITY_DN8346_c0_g1_i1.p1  ORF type:complete len:396 (-),score=65.90 TRINITY_DN8346_c0_g1_i1:159-1346(-)
MVGFMVLCGSKVRQIAEMLLEINTNSSEKVVKINVDTGELKDVVYGFETPAAVAFDEEGLLWVVDAATGEVVSVDLEIDERRAKRVVAKILPGLDNLSFDSRGTLYVTNTAQNAVYRVDVKSGEVQTIIDSLLSVPSGIFFYQENRKDTLYIADFYAYRLIDLKEMEVQTLGIQYEKGVRLEYPTAVFVNQKHIVMSSLYTGIVQVRTKKGKLIAQVKGLASPCQIAELDNGNLLVAEYSSGSVLLLHGQNYINKRVIVNDLHGPVGLALNPCQKFFYVSEYGAGKIWRIHIETGHKMLIYAGLNKPEGISLTPKGSLLVAEVGAQRLLSIHPSRLTRDIIAENLPIGLPAPEGFSPPFILSSVAVDSAGCIYLSSDLKNTILKFECESHDKEDL